MVILLYLYLQVAHRDESYSYSNTSASWSDNTIIIGMLFCWVFIVGLFRSFPKIAYAAIVAAFSSCVVALGYAGGDLSISQFAMARIEMTCYGAAIWITTIIASKFIFSNWQGRICRDELADATALLHQEVKRLRGAMSTNAELKEAADEAAVGSDMGKVKAAIALAKKTKEGADLEAYLGLTRAFPIGTYSTLIEGVEGVLQDLTVFQSACKDPHLRILAPEAEQDDFTKLLLPSTKRMLSTLQHSLEGLSEDIGTKGQSQKVTPSGKVLEEMDRAIQDAKDVIDDRLMCYKNGLDVQVDEADQIEMLTNEESFAFSSLVLSLQHMAEHTALATDANSELTTWGY